MPSSERDYYEVLGVARDATAEAVKKAYRGLARKFHPDVNPGDKGAEAKFKEVQQAYDILSDQEKRALYDRHGRAAFEGMAAAGPRVNPAEWSARFGQPGGPGPGGPGGESFDFSDLFGSFGDPSTHNDPEGSASIFEDLIGRVRGGRAGGKPRFGPPEEASLTIPFLTAVQGGETTIEIQRGVDQSETLVVKIPAGVDTGSKVRLKGQGAPTAAKGRTAGDLTIILTVEPHPYFKREGRDLQIEVPISVSEAILGAKIEVHTLDGMKSLPIPRGSSSGQKLRLKGRGIPASGAKPAGDLFVVVKIVAPKNVDDASRTLIQEFAERNPQDPRAGLW
jgi:curved DNA-binding protein